MAGDGFTDTLSFVNDEDQTLARRLTQYRAALLTGDMPEDLVADLVRDHAYALSPAAAQLRASLERIETMLQQIIDTRTMAS
jgi:hypothetical protein